MAHASCPKCRRRLEQSAEATVDGRTYPVFQCDECVELVTFLGSTFEVAVTLALDEHGRRFNPADPPPELN